MRPSPSSPGSASGALRLARGRGRRCLRHSRRGHRGCRGCVVRLLLGGSRRRLRLRLNLRNERPRRLRGNRVRRVRRQGRRGCRRRRGRRHRSRFFFWDLALLDKVDGGGAPEVEVERALPSLVKADDVGGGIAGQGTLLKLRVNVRGMHHASRGTGVCGRCNATGALPRPKAVTCRSRTLRLRLRSASCWRVRSSSRPTRWRLRTAPTAWLRGPGSRYHRRGPPGRRPGWWSA